MNSCTFFGRLVRDVELRYSQSNVAVGRFTLAVNRAYQKGDVKADFLNMVAFGKTAENIEKFFRQGSRIVVHCHVQNENYTNKDGNKVYQTNFIVDSFSFVDTRAEGGITQNQNTQPAPPPMPTDSDGFMNIPDGIDEELPFS
nr:single-stranded DNA-binding protein [uncultured Blautia sp.]